MSTILKEAKDDGLVWIIITQPLLIYSQMVEQVIFPLLHLALIKQELLTSLQLVQSPSGTASPETEEYTTDIHVST